MILIDLHCTDEWGQALYLKDTRKTCQICCCKSHFVKRMPVEGEPNEEGGINPIYGNACLNCVRNWDEMINHYRE